MQVLAGVAVKEENLTRSILQNIASPGTGYEEYSHIFLEEQPVADGIGLHRDGTIYTTSSTLDGALHLSGLQTLRCVG